MRFSHSQLLLIGSIAIFPFFESRLENLPPAPQSSQALESGSGIPAGVRRALAFGYRAAAADYDWLLAIEYFGTRANENERYGRLYGILDEATDLDPRFEYAYQFGGQSIPFHDPNTDAWYNTKQTIALLEKGVRTHCCKRWQIPWLLSYTRYTYWGDYAQAGKDMELAAAFADHPKTDDEIFAPPLYLHSLAARLLAQSGDIDLALTMTELELQQTVDDKRRDELNARLDALHLEKQLDALNAAAEKLRGAQPNPSIEAIAREAGLPLPAQDPFGAAYVLDASGHVSSPNKDKLLRLRVHPGQTAIEKAVD